MKTIILNENQHKELVKKCLNEEVTFSVNPEIVLMIKKFLDEHFKRCNIEHIDNNGKLAITPIVGMLDSQKNPINQWTDRDLYIFLEDEFKNTFSNEIERKRVLSQIIKDWYYKKITDNGLLSVLH
jgi:hypothetical protein